MHHPVHVQRHLRKEALLIAEEVRRVGAPDFEGAVVRDVHAGSQDASEEGRLAFVEEVLLERAANVCKDLRKHRSGEIEQRMRLHQVTCLPHRQLCLQEGGHEGCIVRDGRVPLQLVVRKAHDPHHELGGRALRVKVRPQLPPFAASLIVDGPDLLHGAGEDGQGRTNDKHSDNHQQDGHAALRKAVHPQDSHLWRRWRLNDPGEGMDVLHVSFGAAHHCQVHPALPRLGDEHAHAKPSARQQVGCEPDPAQHLHDVEGQN
mmetsp:Transcript_14389/g.34295  ORF Transcript_14389/g.34295 Transcript_14389/m.34295 type:complete len:261 (-) Transcript_14389:258-1040(-)